MHFDRIWVNMMMKGVMKVYAYEIEIWMKVKGFECTARGRKSEIFLNYWWIAFQVA